MSKVTFEVNGLRELEKMMLKTLPANVSRNVTLAAMRESARPMEDGAKSQAMKSKRSGSIVDSIGIKTVSKGRTLSGGSMRGTSLATNPYASITVSPLSKPSSLKIYDDYYRRNKSRGYTEVNNHNRIRHAHLVEFGFKHKSGKHVPARPFLRTAFDDHVQDFLRFFRGTLKRKVLAGIRRERAKAILK